MSSIFQLLIFIGVALLAGPTVTAKKYNVTVGYLPCITGEYRNRQGLMISGAVSMALEEINNSTQLLPDVKLLLKWNDTKCDTIRAIKLVTDMIYYSGVVAFFGPEQKCQTEAIIAQSHNLPMISFRCFDYQTSTLSNFARMDPPETQATKYVLSLLRYYRWNRFSILYEEPWSAAALTLEEHATKKNMTVIQRLRSIDSFTCCEENMDCCQVQYMYKEVQQTKNTTRIYVFLGSITSLIDMMTAMDFQQLFGMGEYMVIFVDMMPYSSKLSMKYLLRPEDRGKKSVCPNTPNFIKRAQSLLVVATSELDESTNYNNFARNVQKYSAREPFLLYRPTVFDTLFRRDVSIYAAYLYDSVKLYATALHSLIEEDTTHKNETLTYERLMNVATNGSWIVSRMITNTPFKSVSEMSIRLNEEAVSEGNFTVLAFKPIKIDNDDINCSYSMVPVGFFQQNSKEFPEYKMNPRMPINWPNSVKPEAFMSSCEFSPDEKCSKVDSQVIKLVVAGTLTVTLIFALFYLGLIVKRVKKPRAPRNVDNW